jgi:hypothetical protein
MKKSFHALSSVCLTLAFSGGCFMLSGCESSDDRSYANAQTCLDQAHSATDTNRCVAMVNGLETDSAYLIRCSANFVAQGLTGDRLGTAFQSLKSQTAGQNPTTQMLAYMVFNEADTANNVNTTLNNCQLSKVDSMYKLANAVYAATTFASIAGGGSIPSYLDPSNPAFDPTRLKQAIDTLQSGSTAGQQQQVGSVAQTVNSTFCGTGSTYSTTDICTRIGTAISSGNGDSAAIGAALLAQLSQTH